MRLATTNMPETCVIGITEATVAGTIMPSQRHPRRSHRERQVTIVEPICVRGRLPALPPAPAFAIVVSIALAAAAPLGSAPAVAQSPPGEVLLGTFGAREDGAGSGRGSAGAQSRRSQELDAHRLLEDARDDLSAGYVDAARRQLQTIVRRYPDTAAGRDAQAILARIDGAAGRQAAPSPTAQPGRDGRGDRPPHEAPPERGERGAARSGPARPADGANLRRVKLEQDLRGSAGDRVFFGEGGTELGTKARQVLAAQAAWLTRNPDVVVLIEGHADDAGSAAQNNEIARKRAEAVRQRLVENGVRAERIRVVAHGRDRRVALCADPDCAVQNRRVVTTVADAGAGEAPRFGFAPSR